MESPYNCNHFRLSPEMMTNSAGTSSSAGLSPLSHPSVASSTTSSLLKTGGSVDIHSEYDHLNVSHHLHHHHHNPHHHHSHSIQGNNANQSHHTLLRSNTAVGEEEYGENSDNFNSEHNETRSLSDIMHHQYTPQQQQLSTQGGMTPLDMDDLEQEDLPACAFANMNQQSTGGRMDLASSSIPSTSSTQGGHFGVTGKGSDCKLHLIKCSLEVCLIFRS